MASDRDKLFLIPPTTAVIDDRPTVEAAVNVVLFPEAATMVAEYAQERPYIWTNKPYYAQLLLTENKVLSRIAIPPNLERWIRLVTPTTVNDGPHRWRILTEFDPKYRGFIAIGITKSAARSTMLAGTDWPSVATPDDFLLSTARYFDDTYVSANLYIDGSIFASGETRSNAQRTISLVQVDPNRQTMTVSFRNADAVICDVVVPLPDACTWRPCVTISSAVAATILPWPIDY